MNLLEQLPILLHQTSKLYVNILTDELASIGITKPQILVLEQLKDSRKTVGDISKAVDLSYSTVSGIIDRLEKAGIVTRNRDEKDRRVVWVSLVVHFEELSQKAPFMQKNYHEKLLAGMTSEEAEKITEALHLINQYLDKKRSTPSKERRVDPDESC